MKIAERKYCQPKISITCFHHAIQRCRQSWSHQVFPRLARPKGITTRDEQFML